MPAQGVSRRAGVIAHGKQSAIGTPLATPTVMTSKAGGGLKPMRDAADVPFTRATSARPGQYIQRARGQGTVTVGVFPEAFGLWLKQCMGAETFTAGPPAKHQFQLSDTLPTPQTIYDNMIDTWWRFADAFTTKISLRGNTGELALADIDVTSFQTDSVANPTPWLAGTAIASSPTGATETTNTVTITTTAPHGLVPGQWVVISGVTVTGYNGTWKVATAPTGTTFTYTNPTAGLGTSGSGTVALATTDDSVRYKYAGSVVQAEADGGTPQTLPNAENVTIDIDRAPAYRYGSSIQPTLIYPERMISFSIGVEYDTETGAQGWDFVKAASLGTVGPTGTVTDIQPQGSFFVNFGRNPVDATRYLKVYSGPIVTSDAAPYSANWQFGAEQPDADSGGGPADYDIAGPVTDPNGQGASELTVALANDWSQAY